MIVWLRFNFGMMGMICCLVLVILSGCSIFRAQNDALQKEPPVNLKKMDIHLDDNANLDSATTIDIVMVFKPELLQKLMQMSAAEFNEKIDQLHRDYPQMMTVLHWELTPGQTLRDIDVCVECKSIAAIAFANYFTPGDHRIRIGDAKHIHLELKKRDFCIVEQGCDAVYNLAKNNRQITNNNSMQKQIPIKEADRPLYFNSQRSITADYNQSPTADSISVEKPAAKINNAHNSITEMNRTLGATKSLVNDLPFK